MDEKEKLAMLERAHIALVNAVEALQNKVLDIYRKQTKFNADVNATLDLQNEMLKKLLEHYEKSGNSRAKIMPLKRNLKKKRKAGKNGQ